MRISLEGLAGLADNMADIIRETPFAASRTINDLLFESRIDLNKNTARALDAKKQVSNAHAYTQSNKTNLEGSVYVKDDWHMGVLEHHHEGGIAVPISFEKELQAMGYLKANESILPARGRAQPKKKAYYTMMQGIKRKAGYFVIPSDANTALPPGVYKQLKRSIKLVAYIGSEAQYKKRIDNYAVVKRRVDKSSRRLFRKNMRLALR